MNKKSQDNLKNLLQIKNQTEDTAEIYFYGDIVSSWWGAWDDADQYPDSVKNFLNEVKGKNLNIYINSGGGAVFAGMAIYNMLKRHQGFKTVHVDGLAGSIASVIAFAGDRVIIPSNAFMMIHKPWVNTWGNADELRETAKVLDTIEEGILNVYKENIKEGVDIEIIKEMVTNETWLTGEEASKYFNIEVADPVQAVACISECFKDYKRTPKFFSEKQEEKKKKNYESKNHKEKEKILIELDLI